MAGYGTALAASITGLSIRQVDYLDRKRVIRPDVQGAEGYGSKRLYSFANLVELRTLKRLRDQGINLQKVRKCLAYLHGNLPSARKPLKDLVLCSDGRTVYLGDAKGWMDLLRGGQAVFSVSIGAIWTEIERSVKSAAKAEIHTVKVSGKSYRVVITPDRRDGGFVVDCPTLLGCMSQGETIKEALAEIRDAISGWLSVEKLKKSKASRKQTG